MSILIRLADAFAAPHGIDRYLELVNPAWSVRDIRGTVVQTIRETPTTTTLVVRPNGNWQGHRAGQFVRVGVEIAGIRHTRCYSVSSSAHVRDRITLTVRAKEGGFVSRHLAHDTNPGDVLTLSPAQGEFVLPEARPRRIVMISGGSGITPVMSMLRTLGDERYDGSVTFLHYARSREELIYADELANVNARVLVAFDTVFHPEHLRSIPLEHAEIFLCGPEPMMAAVRACGLRLHEEKFTADVARPSGHGTIHFRRSNVKTSCDGKTMLEIAEESGLKPEHGCRRGICHGCTQRKVSGVVRDLRTGAIDDTPDQNIQLCVSAPVGDVTLDL
jgi:stearoyl-CoA 9-desaturase NADPH oxidoreductase